VDTASVGIVNVSSGAEGPTGVLGTTGSSFSSPPIIIAAALEEEHTTKRPTPAAIIGIDIFVFITILWDFFY
jgi:hypothetical protein